MYERRHQPLMPRGAFYMRLMGHLLGALVLVAGALGVGVLGYHFLAGFSWIDSQLTASMILAGMGPVNLLLSNSAKIFASVYALFAGVIFLVTAGVLFAPLFHRFLHRFHLELDED